IDEDINRNTTVIHNQSTSTYSDTPRPWNNAQQVELLEHNGILYAPIEQENYLGHKKVYKHPYNEVPTSSTMNHHQLDHRRFNKSDNNTNSGYDSSLTTPDSCCHLQKKSISTPKHIRDQLNKSNEKRKKIRHEEVIHQQQPTKYQPSSNIPYQGKSLINKTTTGQTNTITAHTNSIKPYSLPLDQLKRAQAVSDGTINRGTIQLHRLHQSKPITVPVAHSASEYPTLTSNNNNFQPLQNNNKIWPCNSLQTTSNTSTDLTYSITSMMEKIKQELKHEMWAMKDTILNKLQDRFDASSSNIQFHQASLNTINSTITSVLNNVLLPMVNIISDQHQQAKEEIITALRYIEKTFHTQAEHLRANFNIDSNTDRSITTNLSTSTINDNQQSPANDTPTLMEDSDSPLEKNQN
ncbi:unnamed protein product, partial [Rotaria sp. Silwood2]